jgi:Holliday junction DNA helicase RuvA
MISHLNGILEQIDHNFVVLDVNNVGYRVNVPASVLAQLPQTGAKVKLFTIQVVREDDISLYGFITKEERGLFTSLLSVSGIGPKMAMALISGFPLEKLVAAIAQGDITLLSSISGVGKKTAERLVLELRDKIGKAYAIKPTEMISGIKGDSTIVADSISALISLGYSPKEAREAIGQLNLDKPTSVEIIIKQALSKIA